MSFMTTATATTGQRKAQVIGSEHDFTASGLAWLLSVEQ